MTSLQISHWFTELYGDHNLTDEQCKATIKLRESLVSMKIMILGIVLAVDVAAAEIVSKTVPIPFITLALYAMICGSFGLLVHIATYDVWSPKLIAQHAIASVPLAGMFSPIVALATGWALNIDTETSIIAINVATAGALGIGGPYALRKWGQKGVDGAIGLGFQKIGIKENSEKD